jgi:hypothetical protein
MARKKVLNLHRDDDDPRGRLLCPLRAFAFPFDEHSITTVDGFMFTLRLPANDNRRIITLMEDAATARRTARKLKLKKYAWWNGRKIEIDSEEFEHLFARMMRARFRKDRRAIAALMATKDLKFVHVRPQPSAVLSVVPVKLYCKILGGFRKELFRTFEIAKPAAA